MSIIGWIILGLVAGFIASKIVDSSGQGMLMDIVLGIVGAIIANALLGMFGVMLGGWIGYLIAGFIGACILIAVGRAFRR